MAKIYTVMETNTATGSVTYWQGDVKAVKKHFAPMFKVGHKIWKEEWENFVKPADWWGARTVDGIDEVPETPKSIVHVDAVLYMAQNAMENELYSKDKEARAERRRYHIKWKLVDSVPEGTEIRQF